MNILIVKIGALGDVVRSSFIAQALREKYINKDPEIYWITSEKAKTLFINNPYVNLVISPEEIGKISKIYFDIVINLEEDVETGKIVSSLKYGKIAGFFLDGEIINATDSAGEWYKMSYIGPKPQNDILKKQNKKTHREIMGDIIGIKNHEKYEPFLRLNNLQRIIKKDFIRKYNLGSKRLIVGLNTGSGERWPKDLPLDKTLNLINFLDKNLGATILLFGGLNEEKRNREIMKKSKAHIIDTGCGNDIVEFPALVSICNLFITADTLGLHVALALKRRTIVLVGPTSFSEIDMYGIGKKIAAKSDCLCCYKKDCKSMQKIDLKEVKSAIRGLLDDRVTVVITAYKEPKTIGRAIEAAINQKGNYKYDVLISAPDEETLNVARHYSQKYNNVKIFKDPGKGKMFALNQILEKIDTDIFILTDGDVWISENSVKEILQMFSDPEIGCITGRPVPIEKRDSKYGYWANFLFEQAHKLRKLAFENNRFLECSGYLFSFRNIKNIKIPLDTAEDTIIPYYFWEKGYRVGYAEKAEVYIKNVSNWSDWIKQKTRTSKAHETLNKYVDTQITPRVKSFKNEVSGGYDLFFTYPRSLKQFWWSILLAFSRFFMWSIVIYETKTKKQNKIDNWERVESTK
jgi:heptosyltransferase-2